jgi:formimidoylglutamate deiminase
LFEGALAGGTAAAGMPLGGLAVGQRADFAVVDMEAPALLGVPQDNCLEALVFSSPEADFIDVFVAGRRVLMELDESRLAQDFQGAMRALWA